MLGQALRKAREKRGLSRAQAAEELNHVPFDPEQALRSSAARSVMAAHIRRKDADLEGGYLITPPT